MKYVLAIIFTSLFLLSACAPGVEVTDFESCVAAGNPVLESLPEQCVHEGVTYVNAGTASPENPASGTVLAGSQQEQCEAFGGTWLTEHSECEGIDSQSCIELGGNFNECASACRHQPDGRVCTMQCVLVCQFNQESTEILTIAPQKETCVGVGQQECLIVNGELFYDEIAGFNFEEGYEYILEVSREERENLPADASRFTYQLVEVVQKISQNRITCTDEQLQAEICTLEYMPVCGDDGQTYGNVCGACASGNVRSYTQGEC